MIVEKIYLGRGFILNQLQNNKETRIHASSSHNKFLNSKLKFKAFQRKKRYATHNLTMRVCHTQNSYTPLLATQHMREGMEMSNPLGF